MIHNCFWILWIPFKDIFGNLYHGPLTQKLGVESVQIGAVLRKRIGMLKTNSCWKMDDQHGRSTSDVRQLPTGQAISVLQGI